MTERQLKQYITPATRREIRSSQCIPDLIQPSEIAEVALFLASQASTALTARKFWPTVAGGFLRSESGIRVKEAARTAGTDS
jgi:NAD(P)-dependent dehydrogenase (short-subunit alcohol dehydrogenase family)